MKQRTKHSYRALQRFKCFTKRLMCKILFSIIVREAVFWVSSSSHVSRGRRLRRRRVALVLVRHRGVKVGAELKHEAFEHK